jgi:CheY-like chemotaxis protein
VSDRPGRRVLVVEDDPVLRELVAGHLRKRRFEVLEADSAEAVLRAVGDRSLTYDLALVDVHLPGKSGLELARLLLARSPLRPVLMATGDEDAEVARRALGSGAAGYLLKPFELFELDAALAQAVAMLDLVETTEVLARAQAGHLDDWGEAGGLLPRAWVHLGDERSGAGPGHGARVVSVASLLARVSGVEMTGRQLDVLRAAARAHEIGRLLGPASPQEIALRSGQLLTDLGFDPEVAEVVRQAADSWSPGLSLLARMLSLADRLDHDAVHRLGRGTDPGPAIRTAVDAMLAAAGESTDPELARHLAGSREAVESMWVVQRDPVDPVSDRTRRSAGV